jgi:hypothetical protein
VCGQGAASKVVNVFVYSINRQIYRSTHAKSPSAIETPSAKQIANGRISHGQITIREALGLTPSQNEEHNYALDQLKRLFDSKDSERLLMDWIVMDNL